MLKLTKFEFKKKRYKVTTWWLFGVIPVYKEKIEIL